MKYSSFDNMIVFFTKERMFDGAPSMMGHVVNAFKIAKLILNIPLVDFASACGLDLVNIFSRISSALKGSNESNKTFGF